MVMRIKFSVPEGRTRSRPSTDWRRLLKSSRSFLAASEVLRDCFCSGVAGRLMMTWGNSVMMLARELKGRSALAMTDVRTSAVSMPSPVAWPGRIIWPDCSPPSWMFLARMASATLLSPTAVISRLTLAFLAQLKRPWFAMTVMARESKSKCLARMARIWSPSISAPVSSIIKTRSPSPSKATPKSRWFSRTSFWRASRWVLPQFWLISVL